MPSCILKYLLSILYFQVIESGNPKADEIVLSNMTVALDRILLDVEVILNFVSTYIMSKLLRKQLNDLLSET